MSAAVGMQQSPSIHQQGSATPASSRFAHFVKKLTPSSSSSTMSRSNSNSSIHRQQQRLNQSPAGDSDDGEDAIEVPEFYSSFMKQQHNQNDRQERSKSSLGFASGESSSLRKSSSWLSTASSVAAEQQQSSLRPARRRQSEEGTASSPCKSDAQRHAHRRSPTAAALSALGLSNWNKSKENLVSGLKRTGSGHVPTSSSGEVCQAPQDKANETEEVDEDEVTRPPLTRLPSLDATQTQSALSNISHKTPGGSSAAHNATATLNGTVNIGAGLSESSKRFRSAFRMRTKPDGSSLRRPGRAVQLREADENGNLGDASESDRSPEDHVSYNSSTSQHTSPDDVALARSMDRVQLVQDSNLPSTSAASAHETRQSVDTLRPVFNSSRLQSRLEAASLVPASSSSSSPDSAPPIPAKSSRRSPPYGSLRSGGQEGTPSPPAQKQNFAENLVRSSFDVQRPVAANANTKEAAQFRASHDLPRRTSPNALQSSSLGRKAVDFRREAAIIVPPSQQPLAPRSNEQPLRVFSDTQDKQETSPSGYKQPAEHHLGHRPNGSLTLRQGNYNVAQQNNNNILRIHADAENIPPPSQQHRSSASSRSTSAMPLGLKKASSHQQLPRAPLLDIPASRQHHQGQHLSNGPIPADRVIPLKPASQSPPLERADVLPDLPPSSVAAPQPSFPSVTAPPQGASNTTGTTRKAVQVVVNGKQYLRSALIGKGGSSRVYRITDRDHNVFAFKRVELGRGDLETYTSFCNEIELLKRLRGHDRIIQLIDAEVNEVKKTLVMVLEIGEIDLNSLLQEKIGKRVSMNFIRQTWEQMLECVKVVHDAGIVHTDLKPANFVLVKGALKLIDFGIAKAIPSDTTNIARDQQIGTANYMSPEALCDSGRGVGGERLMKMGRASDVWSLGCILYQMVYGTTPFGHFRNLPQKMMAIQNPLHVIAFPSHAVPKSREGVELSDVAVRVEADLLRVMKSCLRFESKQRSTIPELLEDPFLRGDADAPVRDDAISADVVAAIVSRTLQWSNGRMPSRGEQERFVENILLQLAN